MIKHVCWDLDGTLYRPTPQLEKELNALRLKLYAELTNKRENSETWQEYQTLYAELNSHSAIFASLGKPKEYWHSHRNKLKVTTYLESEKRTVEMFKEFSKLNVTHGIFTDNMLVETKKILATMKIPLSIFKYILTIEQVGRPKPSLGGFRKVVELSKVKAEEILFVGDRVYTDLVPAKQLGMQTALVWSDEKYPEADYTFPHVADVLKVFK
ncbi:MAG: HAD family hydrolase [Candidatus Micrarchaeota archaeon]|nr:HAD family hydrolase [Candidatus Micrarchaeota archaeon]